MSIDTSSAVVVSKPLKEWSSRIAVEPPLLMHRDGVDDAQLEALIDGAKQTLLAWAA